MKIGEFARLSRISIRMLRHYDEVGVLKPASVDAQTGYRQYRARQLHTARRLNTLRLLGFTLEELRPLLTDAASPDDYRPLLLARLDTQRQRVSEEQARLTRIETFLHTLESEEPMNFDIQIKALPALTVASLRDLRMVHPAGEGGQDMSAMWTLLYERFPGASALGATTVLWHESAAEGLPEPELLQPVMADAAVAAPFKVKTLPPVASAAFLIYHGHYADPGMTEAFGALHAWAEANGQTDSSVRQVFQGERTIELQLPLTS